MNWEIIGSIIAAVLGSSTIVTLIQMLINRKTNARTAEAKADADEFGVLKETNLFLQEQLKDSQQNIRDLNAEITKLNADRLNDVVEFNTLKLSHSQIESDYKVTLAKLRCETLECPFRQPPNAYTPAHAEGDTIEHYQQRLHHHEEVTQQHQTD